MSTNVQIYGDAPAQSNIWKGIAASGGIQAKANIDFNDLSGDLSLAGVTTSATDPTWTSVGGLIKSDLEHALSAAGYIKASACPKNSASQSDKPQHSASQSDKPQHSASQSDNSKNNLWNGLSIAMTCATGVLLLTVMLMMIRRGRM